MVQVIFTSLFWHFLYNYMCLLNKNLRSLPYNLQNHRWLTSLTSLTSFVCEMLLIHPSNSVSPFLSTFLISNHDCRCTWYVPRSFPLASLFLHCQFLKLWKCGQNEEVKWAISGPLSLATFLICKTSLAKIVSGMKRKADSMLLLKLSVPWITYLAS